MNSEAQYYIHSICLYSVLLIVWLVILIIFIHQSRGIKVLRVLYLTTVLFIVGGIISWIIAVMFYIVVLIGNDDDDILLGWFNIVYIIIYFPIPHIMFYLFIMARLKLAFKRTAFEVSCLYFLVIAIIAVISLIFKTFGEIYFCYLFYYGPDNDIDNSLHELSICAIDQFDIIDPLIKLSVIYVFNRKLFQVMVLQGNEANERSVLSVNQHIPLTVITKQTLLICTMIISNFIYFTWIKIKPYDFDKVTIWNVIGDYIFVIMNIVQLLCVYLGFAFADKLYSRLCSPPNVNCASVWVIIEL